MTMLEGSGSGIQRRGSEGTGCPVGPSLSLPGVALGIELNELANAL